ncbi:MAG: conjugal transfer protein [Bacilli bacterium]|nr:conjugal transfer protein [Bacilli bacterium]
MNNKKIPSSFDNLLSYSMKLALLNQLFKLNKITEREYSLIKAKIKLEHKIS